MDDIEIEKEIIFVKNYNKYKEFLPIYSDIYYSQEGEDMIIRRLLKKDYFKKGFYVDIGAHHPIRFSNTFHFYLNGWNGINVEPQADVINIFNKIRPKDINVNYAISDSHSEKDFFCFNEPAFNTLSEKQANFVLKTHLNVKLIDKRKVIPKYLSEILDEYVPTNKKIDFLNIDVEGLEKAVLLSNNWNKYIPNLIIVEQLETKIEKIKKTFVYKMLKKIGYNWISKTKNSLIFQHKDYKP